MEKSDAKKRQQFLFRTWGSAHAYGYDISIEEDHQYLEAILCNDERTCCTLLEIVSERQKGR